MSLFETIVIGFTAGVFGGIVYVALLDWRQRVWLRRFMAEHKEQPDKEDR